MIASLTNIITVHMTKIIIAIISHCMTFNNAVCFRRICTFNWLTKIQSCFSLNKMQYSWLHMLPMTTFIPCIEKQTKCFVLGFFGIFTRPGKIGCQRVEYAFILSMKQRYCFIKNVVQTLFLPLFSSSLWFLLIQAFRNITAG